MSAKNQNLLRETSRSLEIVLGIVSAVISVLVASLLVWLVYIVGWRNPREYGTHDLFRMNTLLVFLLLFAIAFGFSVLSFRLFGRKKAYLMSATLLRIWGVFFAAGSVCVLIDCIMKKNWGDIKDAWESLSLSISMAVAAFALAQKQKTKK